MECQEVRDRIAEYLNQELPEEARADVNRHVADCPVCRVELEGLTGIWDMLDEIPADAPDSSVMRHRFQQMLEAHAPSSVRAAEAPKGDLSGWWPWRPAIQMAFAVSVFLVGLLIGSVQPYRFAPRADQSAELRGELRDLRQMLALSLLRQESASERLSGVNWSNHVDPANGAIVGALLDTLLHDPNVNVRLASVDALRRFSRQATVRKLTAEALVEVKSPLVQAALIDFAVESKNTDATQALRQLAADATAEQTIRDRARSSLQQLGL